MSIENIKPSDHFQEDLDAVKNETQDELNDFNPLSQDKESKSLDSASGYTKVKKGSREFIFYKDKYAKFGKPIDVDFDSFEALNTVRARDKNSMYALGVKVEGIDPETFELIGGPNEAFVKDKNNVYYDGKKLEGADPDSFRIRDDLAPNFVGDKDGVWSVIYKAGSTEILLSGKYKADGASLRRVEFSRLVEYMWVEEEGVNVSRFGFGPEYLTDKDSVYYRGKKLEGADPDTFEMETVRRLSGGKILGYFPKDNVSCYLDGVVVSEKEIMDSFENRDPNYVILENSKKIYFNSQEVEGADPDSFELLPDPEYNRAGFAKDKNNVYYNGKKLEGVDPDSFDAMFGAKVPIMRDKNYVYYKLGGANFVKIEGSSPQKLKFIDRPSGGEWNLSYYEDERYKYYDNTMVVDHIDGKEDEVTEIYDKKNKTYYPL